jgi:hypothetical protein
MADRRNDPVCRARIDGIARSVDAALKKISREWHEHTAAQERRYRRVGRMLATGGACLLVAVVAGGVLLRAEQIKSGQHADRLQDQDRQIKAEAAMRRDENCRIFEDAERTAVERLTRTYEYLDQLPAEDRGTNLTRAVLRGLPAQEAAARAPGAPGYCRDVRLPRGRVRVVGLRDLDPPLRPPARRDFSELSRPAP